MQRIPRFALLLAAITVLATSTVRAADSDDAFYLQGGDRIIFFGDSITQSGGYIDYVETFLATRFPDLEFTVINHGISSETISGTSETDHDPPRPDAKKRFTRDITEWTPDVVVACFGMNDGNYYPPEMADTAAYRRGVAWLIEHVRDEAAARLTLMTPPPFDPYRRKNSDPEAIEYGYKYPSVDYDDTLTVFAQHLLSIEGEDLPVVDLHTKMNEHLRSRRATKVSFCLAGDAVHPAPTGHWLMAMHLLEKWNAPALCSELTIDAADGLTKRWTTPLPMAIDPRWDMQSIDLEKMSERLNRHRLTVRGLDADASYQLLANGEPIAAFTGAELAEGVDLTRLPTFPTTKRAAEVLALVQQRRGLNYSAWRKSLSPNGGDALEAAKAPSEELLSKINALRGPMEVDIEIKPAK